MALSLEPTKFTPRQVEQICGVTVAQQRNLRRHKYLPSVEGHARFDVYEMAHVYVLQLMSDRGIGPKDASEVAEICATGITHHALAYPEAYSGDHDRIIEAGIIPPIAPYSQDVIDALREAARNTGADEARAVAAVSAESTAALAQSAFLQRYVGNLFRRRAIPARFFIWWADGAEMWTESLDEAFDDVADADPRKGGAVLVMDLPSVGWQFTSKSQLPFFDVKISDLAPRERAAV